MPQEGGERATQLTVDVTLCLSANAAARLRPSLQQACVGLVAEQARVRIVTDAETASAFESLGPTQVLAHGALSWPLRQHRLHRLVEALSERPPNVIAGVGWGAYALADELADHFDADVVYHVTCTDDAAVVLAAKHPAHVPFIAYSEPLHRILLEGTPSANPDGFHLIRPGVLRGTQRREQFAAGIAASVVCTAPLDAAYSVDLLIGAIAELCQQGHSIMLFLLGEGPNDSALRRLATARGIGSRVTFARVWTHAVEVLAGADAVVLLPQEQEISAIPLQAMAHGAVVVAPDGGGGDYLHQGQTAVLYQEPTEAALAAAIGSLLANPEEAQRLAASAYDYVKEHHQTSRLSEETMAVYRGLLRASRTLPMSP